jgi:Protein of unknown function (DUF2934)
MPKTSEFDSALGSSEMRAMIAERAYYKAERRGFVPGFEMTDWLEAEREFSGPAITGAEARPRKKSAARKAAVKRTKASAKK